MVCVIQVSWQLASKLSANLYVLLCVQWKTPDDGQRNCPKHVEFYSKNKFKKLEHLVGFIIRIYHDARSPERHISTNLIHFACMMIVYRLTWAQYRPLRAKLLGAFIQQLAATNPLTPNDHYSDRTAPLTSKRCILYIYSTNISTAYFKHGIYSPFVFFFFKMQFVS